jgi:RNA polymerase sigma factor (sigma-70 family)
MESDDPGGAAALPWTDSGWPAARGRTAADSAAAAVGALYQDHAVGLIMRAVRQLPGRQREALVLRYYLDLPEREIARLMGLRPSSVRSATARALKALGHALEEPS